MKEGDRGTVEERFWNKVRISDVGCWEWTGAATPSGRGWLFYKGKNHIAPRIAWTIHFGDIPEGMSVCHSCDNPKCVRPSHLFIGTKSDNMRDAVKKQRLRCSKLLPEQVVEIRKDLAAGHTKPQTAKKFKVAINTIYDISNGDTWSYV